MPDAAAAVIARRALPTGWSLLAVSGAGWAVLLSSGAVPILPALCGPAGHDWASLPDRVDTMMRLASPWRLPLSWAAMLCAMMLPLLRGPLAAIGTRRARAGFVIGCCALWLPAIAAIALGSAAVAAVTAARPVVGILIALAVAAAWQGSAVRARCLARCRRRPVGGVAGGAAFGRACVGSCWAAMLVPYLAGPLHLPAMIAVTALLAIERRRPPAGQASPGRTAVDLGCGVGRAGPACPAFLSEA